MSGAPGAVMRSEPSFAAAIGGTTGSAVAQLDAQAVARGAAQHEGNRLAHGRGTLWSSPAQTSASPTTSPGLNRAYVLIRGTDVEQTPRLSRADRLGLIPLMTTISLRPSCTAEAVMP